MCTEPIRLEKVHLVSSIFVPADILEYAQYRSIQSDTTIPTTNPKPNFLPGYVHMGSSRLNPKPNSVTFGVFHLSMG